MQNENQNQSFDNNPWGDTEPVASAPVFDDQPAFDGDAGKTPGMGTAALIMGIVSLVMTVISCCCCGWISIIAFILSVAGIFMAISAKKQMTEMYGAASGKVKAAIPVNIVGAILAVLAIVMWIISQIFLRSSGGVQKILESMMDAM